MSFCEQYPLYVSIKDGGLVKYPNIRAFLEDWKVSYNKLCRYVYTGDLLEVENRRSEKYHLMKVGLPKGWKCEVYYEQKCNTAKRYRIKKED